MRLAMWIVPLLCWGGFFALFWNVKRWHWSVAKIVGAAFGCGLAAAVAVLAVGLAFITLFD